MGIFGKPFFQSGFGCVPVDYLKDTYPSTWLTILDNQREYIENKSMCGRNYHNYGSMDGEYQDYVYDFFTSGESEDILEIVFDFVGGGEEEGEKGTFGNDEIESGEKLLDERVLGQVATCPNASVQARNISVALKYSGTQSTWSVRCGLYVQSNLSLVAETEERSIQPTASYAWYTFEFLTYPTLSNITYIIVAHASNEVGTLHLAIDWGGGGTGWEWIRGIYGALPSTLSGSSYGYDFSIYCTFLITGDGEPPIPPELTVSAPENTTYGTHYVSVNLSAVGGTIDQIWYNCWNGSDWIYGSNQTYSTTTTMENFANGTYLFYGWANNTDGYSDQETVWFSVTIPTGEYESPTVTSSTVWYLRSDTHTVNTVLGYKLSETPSTSYQHVTANIFGDATVYYGWRIWKVNNKGSETELTDGEIYSWRVNNGVGVQNLVWTPPATSLHTGQDAIMMKLYIKFGAGSWVLKATFISDKIVEKSLLASQWDIQTYTYRFFSYSEDTTIAEVYWAGNPYGTVVGGIGFETPNVYEGMQGKLFDGDFIGFVLYPYLNLVGNLFYGLVMLIVCVPLYNRYKSVTPLLVMLILFGGAAGIFTLLIPGVGLTLGWIVFLIGLGGLLYKVFR